MWLNLTKIFETGVIFNEGLIVFSEVRGTFFFFLLTSIYLFSVKETRLEMTAWEKLGQVFLCNKQHPYGNCIACFVQNQMQTHSNTRVLFQILLGRFPWHFSSWDSGFHCRGHEVDPWSENQDPTCLEVSLDFLSSHWSIFFVDWLRDCHTE